MTSSRKFGIGLVQETIDAAEETGTLVRHWNIIDVATPCPPERHCPNEPKVPIYHSQNTLKRYSALDFAALTGEQKKDIEVEEGYAGCLKNCRIYAVCRGRLAQPRKACRLHKPLHHVQNLFRGIEVEIAKAQLMCWKPSSFGKIYPNFDASVHVISAQKMANMITGTDNSPDMNKAQFIELCKQSGLAFFSGMDHGFTHEFSVVTGVKDGNRFFVLDVIAQSELELSQKIDICNAKIKFMDPAIYADPEDPASNKTLSRYFRMKDWKKTPGSVVGGINIIRHKLMPTMGTLPQLFFLADDEGVNRLVKDIQKYHWKIDPQTGRPSDEPDEVVFSENGVLIGDDKMDALRYLIMNVFPPRKGGLVVPKNEDNAPVIQKQYTTKNWMAGVIAEHTGLVTGVDEEQAGPVVQQTGKKGSLFWSL